MNMKQAYAPPVVETYAVIPVGKVLMFSGENKNEKFVIDEQNQYNDSDFV
jgi:hypothetical protein